MVSRVKNIRPNKKSGIFLKIQATVITVCFLLNTAVWAADPCAFTSNSDTIAAELTFDKVLETLTPIAEARGMEGRAWLDSFIGFEDSFKLKTALAILNGDHAALDRIMWDIILPHPNLTIDAARQIEDLFSYLKNISDNNPRSFDEIERAISEYSLRSASSLGVEISEEDADKINEHLRKLSRDSSEPRFTAGYWRKNVGRIQNLFAIAGEIRALWKRLGEEDRTLSEKLFTVSLHVSQRIPPDELVEKLRNGEIEITEEKIREFQGDDEISDEAVAAAEAEAESTEEVAGEPKAAAEEPALPPVAPEADTPVYETGEKPATEADAEAGAPGIKSDADVAVAEPVTEIPAGPETKGPDDEEKVESPEALEAAEGAAVDTDEAEEEEEAAEISRRTAEARRRHEKIDLVGRGDGLASADERPVTEEPETRQDDEDETEAEAARLSDGQLILFGAPEDFKIEQEELDVDTGKGEEEEAIHESAKKGLFDPEYLERRRQERGEAEMARRLDAAKKAIQEREEGERTQEEEARRNRGSVLDDNSLEVGEREEGREKTDESGYTPTATADLAQDAKVAVSEDDVSEIDSMLKEAEGLSDEDVADDTEGEEGADLSEIERQLEDSGKKLDAEADREITQPPVLREAADEEPEEIDDDELEDYDEDEEATDIPEDEEEEYTEADEAIDRAARIFPELRELLAKNPGLRERMKELAFLGGTDRTDDNSEVLLVIMDKIRKGNGEELHLFGSVSNENLREVFVFLSETEIDGKKAMVFKPVPRSENKRGVMLFLIGAYAVCMDTLADALKKRILLNYVLVVLNHEELKQASMAVRRKKQSPSLKKVVPYIKLSGLTNEEDVTEIFENACAVSGGVDRLSNPRRDSFSAEALVSALNWLNCGQEGVPTYFERQPFQDGEPDSAAASSETSDDFRSSKPEKIKSIYDVLAQLRIMGENIADADNRKNNIPTVRDENFYLARWILEEAFQRRCAYLDPQNVADILKSFLGLRYSSEELRIVLMNGNGSLQDPEDIEKARQLIREIQNVLKLGGFENKTNIKKIIQIARRIAIAYERKRNEERKRRSRARIFRSAWQLVINQRDLTQDLDDGERRIFMKAVDQLRKEIERKAQDVIYIRLEKDRGGYPLLNEFVEKRVAAFLGGAQIPHSFAPFIRETELTRFYEDYRRKIRERAREMHQDVELEIIGKRDKTLRTRQMSVKAVERCAEIVRLCSASSDMYGALLHLKQGLDVIEALHGVSQIKLDENMDALASKFMSDKPPFTVPVKRILARAADKIEEDYPDVVEEYWSKTRVFLARVIDAIEEIIRKINAKEIDGHTKSRIKRELLVLTLCDIFNNRDWRLEVVFKYLENETGTVRERRRVGTDEPFNKDDFDADFDENNVFAEFFADFFNLGSENTLQGVISILRASYNNLNLGSWNVRDRHKELSGDEQTILQESYREWQEKYLEIKEDEAREVSGKSLGRTEQASAEELRLIENVKSLLVGAVRLAKYYTFDRPVSVREQAGLTETFKKEAVSWSPEKRAKVTDIFEAELKALDEDGIIQTTAKGAIKDVEYGLDENLVRFLEGVGTGMKLYDVLPEGAGTIEKRINRNALTALEIRRLTKVLSEIDIEYKKNFEAVLSETKGEVALMFPDASDISGKKIYDAGAILVCGKDVVSEAPEVTALALKMVGKFTLIKDKAARKSAEKELRELGIKRRGIFFVVDFSRFVSEIVERHEAEELVSVMA